jgi:hypothetical protein
MELHFNNHWDAVRTVGSLTAWSGLAAGIGSALLAGRKIMLLTLIPSQITFAKGLLIGGSAILVAATTFVIGHKIFKDRSNGLEDTDDYLKYWGWVSFIPLMAVPYLARVSFITGTTLVALGILGLYAKGKTVGILPE